VTVGLQDSTWSLVLVYPTITIPVSVWLLIGFLKAIPRDVEEQAMVDGYSRLAAFVRMVLPLTFPGIVAVVVFAFTLTASEFIYALALVSPTAEKVVSTGVATELIRGDVFFWQSLQAAAILVAVPIAFVFNLFLDRFISGFTMGAGQGLTGAAGRPIRVETKAATRHRQAAPTQARVYWPVVSWMTRPRPRRWPRRSGGRRTPSRTPPTRPPRTPAGRAWPSGARWPPSPGRRRPRRRSCSGAGSPTAAPAG
jgi:ABC-type Fe3+ transport system permease subunit